MRFDPARMYTFGETLGPAMEVQTAEEAKAYLDDLVAWHDARLGLGAEVARKHWLESIGYWTGYYSRETAERVFRLFDTAHPIFGRTQPTAEEAFDAGVAHAKRMTSEPAP